MVCHHSLVRGRGELELPASVGDRCQKTQLVTSRGVLTKLQTLAIWCVSRGKIPFCPVKAEEHAQATPPSTWSRSVDSDSLLLEHPSLSRTFMSATIFVLILNCFNSPFVPFVHCQFYRFPFSRPPPNARCLLPRPVPLFTRVKDDCRISSVLSAPPPYCDPRS